jgi:hypothetical protein
MWQKLIGGTGRPLATWLYEHRHSLRESPLEKLKVVQPAYEEGHRVGWDEAKILEIEINSKHRLYRESTDMACLANLISQLNLEIFSHMDSPCHYGG